MKTSALTLPLSMIMNRRWPREVTSDSCHGERPSLGRWACRLSPPMSAPRDDRSGCAPRRVGIPTARAKAEQVFALVDASKTREAAAEELGISIRSIFRILPTRKDAGKAPVGPPGVRIAGP